MDVLLYDGFDELDAVGRYEVFSTARAFCGDVAVRLVTLDPTSSSPAAMRSDAGRAAVLEAVGREREDEHGGRH